MSAVAMPYGPHSGRNTVATVYIPAAHSRRGPSAVQGRRSFDVYRSDRYQDLSGSKRGRSASISSDRPSVSMRRPMAESQNIRQTFPGDLPPAPSPPDAGVQRPDQHNARSQHLPASPYPPSSMRRSVSNRNSLRPSSAREFGRAGSEASQQPEARPRTSGSVLSFYDVKELRKQGYMRPPAAPQQRWSWANLKGDAISEHYFDATAPPHMGAPPQPPRPSKEFRHGLPWTVWMNSTAKNHFVASVGEIVGTTMFLFFAFAGCEVANIGDNTAAGTTTNETTGFNPTKLLYISLSFGFSLVVNAWIFFRISGGLFNPAVTLAMLLVGAVGPIRALCLFASQIIGSIAASAMVMGIFPAKLNVLTTLSEPTSLARGVFIEAFLTAELVFTILMLAKEKHRATFVAPVGIGLALFITQLVGVFYTGGSVNPARSFGPCVVSNTWDKNHWIYWVGPILGALIAVAFYKFIKLLEYEMANPGQDADDWNDPTKNPDHEVRERQRRKTMSVLNSLGLDHIVHPHHHDEVIDEEQPPIEPRLHTRDSGNDNKSAVGPTVEPEILTDVEVGESAAGMRV